MLWGISIHMNLNSNKSITPLRLIDMGDNLIISQDIKSDGDFCDRNLVHKLIHISVDKIFNSTRIQNDAQLFKHK